MPLLNISCIKYQEINLESVSNKKCKLYNVHTRDYIHTQQKPKDDNLSLDLMLIWQQSSR